MKFSLCFMVMIVSLVGLAMSDPIEQNSANKTEQVNTNDIKKTQNAIDETKQSCKSDTECNHGICNDRNLCECTTGYVNFDGRACSYEQKSKLKTFLLSVFLGNFGADWFYLATGNSLSLSSINSC